MRQSCCNPAHLFLGTQADNVRDREQKGRGNQPKGEKNAFAKLTADKVLQIRARYAEGNETCQSLADEYGVANNTISCILRRIYWKWL